MTDEDLLRRYTDDGSEPAFAELVERHLNLVYSVARRHVPSSSLAEDVAQTVFIELARNARRIKSGTPLIAWLHVVARRSAINATRADARRRSREQAAAELGTASERHESAMKSRPSDWAEVEPLLDEAVESLTAADRAALLLRYFENKSLREVGAALGTSDDAAQKRVSRAIEQLRRFFLRRGVAATAGSLASDLSAHALQVAPAGLAGSITATSSIAAHATTGAVTTFTMTALHKVILGGALVAVVGGAVFEGNALRAQRTDMMALRQRADALATQGRKVRQQHADALSRLSEVQKRLDALAAASLPPADATIETQMNAWLERVARLKELREQRPDLGIPEISFLPDESWFQSARDLRLETEDQIRDAFAALRNRAEYAFNAKLRAALAAYLDAHDGTLPDDAHELAAFFDPPVNPALLDRYKMAAHGKIADVSGGTVIEQHSPLDFTRDTMWDIGLHGIGSESALSAYVIKAIESFTDTNNGVKPTSPEQLQPYLPAPVDAARLQPYVSSRR
ncbi:MAG TPA: sigma-70 family RNA polymerase sigma factor [Opitutaceae bacterium]|nr:sigma-70 family RNA polymerase sigma factor [Opitutaceae bacterium]